MRRTRARLVAVLAAVLSVVLVATGSLLATPSSAAAVRYEAESATISQGVVESNHAGFSGTGFVNYDNVVGSFVRLARNSPRRCRPRATSTARQATLHLQPTPGTDLAVANALLHVAIAEGLLDGDYIATRTTGFDEVRATVAGYWPARVERLSGVPAADLEAAARLLGSARRAVILTGRGAEQHAQGTDTVTAYINLALALGLPGRPGSGYGCITGQGNGQGGREHGQKADQLPGYRRIDDPSARAHVARVWGVDEASLPGPGVSATELLDRLGTRDGPRA